MGYLIYKICMALLNFTNEIHICVEVKKTSWNGLETGEFKHSDGEGVLLSLG